MKTFFKNLFGTKSTKTIRKARKAPTGQFRPMIEALEERALMACSVSLQFDTLHQVPYINIQGGSGYDQVLITITKANELYAGIGCGDTKTNHNIKFNLNDGYSPGYIAFYGYE